MLRPWMTTSAMTLLLITSACGGSSARGATHADFDTLQQEEARADRAATVLADSSASCANRLRASADLTSARDNACALADAVDDADVRARCEALVRLAVTGEATRRECAPPE